eukprot:6357926-Amphidinium_carterae.1
MGQIFSAAVEQQQESEEEQSNAKQEFSKAQLEMKKLQCQLEMSEKRIQELRAENATLRSQVRGFARDSFDSERLTAHRAESEAGLAQD